MSKNFSDFREMIPLLRKQIPAMIAQKIVGVQPMSANQLRMLKLRNPSKYKFSRAKWYVADFDDKDYFEVEKWCAEQFGPHPRHPDAWSRWHHTYSEQIHFRDEKDYVLFCLRWS